MFIWILLLIIVGSGAVGGLIGSLVRNKGFTMPGNPGGGKIFDPGTFGDILAGAAAAAVSWALYGSLNQAVITGTATLVLANVAEAFIIGMTGAGWLGNLIGKKLFQQAVVLAATAQPSASAARQLETATPREAFKIAKGMQQQVM